MPDADHNIQKAANEAVFYFARQGVVDYLKNYVDEALVNEDDSIDALDILHVFTAYVAEFAQRPNEAACEKLVDDALQVVKMHANMVEGVDMAEETLLDVVEYAITLFPRSMFELCLQMVDMPVDWTYENFSETIHLATLEGVLGTL